MPEKKVAKVVDKYSFFADDIKAEVKIIERPDEFNYIYEISMPEIAPGTKVLLHTSLRAELVSSLHLDLSDILDPKKFPMVKARYREISKSIIDRHFPTLPEEKKNILITYLVYHSLGLGDLEILEKDENLEEIVINNAKEPIWVYHKKWGWCKTNLKVRNEETIFEYASNIARRIGRQINTLNPILDAHLPNGDRVNATLFPISNFGNTITIRKFSKNPWTMPILIKNKTISFELAALVWLMVQAELSILIVGGTGSGKTSFLNALAGFIPANNRVISIEDTRELTLPSFMQWVPLVTREPNPEGKGEVTMEDLLVNALRMRPDRILVGEIRRREEAEILFEAMNTGHSVYATLHADDSEQAITRLTNPPLSVPRSMLYALAGIVVQYRHRRFNIRRTFEFSEMRKDGTAKVLYRWNARTDTLRKIANLDRIAELINLYTGMTESEIKADINEKVKILKWMVKNEYFDVNKVGEIVSRYYKNPDEILELVK